MIYTHSTFRLDATTVISKFDLGALNQSGLVNKFEIVSKRDVAGKLSVLALSIAATSFIAAPAQAQEDASADANKTWRENTIARCMQQYSVEQCQDEEFLEENFHVNSLEIAHRAAIRRKQQNDKALHELILQRVCTASPSTVCDDSEQCIAEVTRTCATLKAEATACVQRAKTNCSTTNDPSSCYQAQVAQCPSTKKLTIAELLAKYPKLSDSQKARLISTAAQLDAKTSGWWSNLVNWLTTPFI